MSATKTTDLMARERAVYETWLACPPDPAVDQLAHLALDFASALEASNAVVRAAVAITSKQDATIDRLRESGRG